MLVKIKSYKPYNEIYGWYGHLIGKTVNVRERQAHQKDYIINDSNSGSVGTIWDSCIHESDIEIITQ